MTQLATHQPAALGFLKLETTQEKIRALIPPSLSFDRFNRLAVSLCHRNPKIAECEPVSFMATLSDCATIGVYPDPITGQAYIIPRWNKKANGGKGALEATLLVGYKGLRSIALRSPDILDLWTGVVRRGDLFKIIRAPRQELIHEPLPEESGEIVGYYSVAALRNGLTNFEWMPVADVAKIRDTALSQLQDWQRETSPWKLYESEMGRKTVLRRHFKSLPLRPEDQEAVARDIELEERNGVLEAAAPDASAPVRPPPPPREAKGVAAAVENAKRVEKQEAPPATTTDAGAAPAETVTQAPAEKATTRKRPSPPPPPPPPPEPENEEGVPPFTKLADGETLKVGGIEVVEFTGKHNKTGPYVEAQLKGPYTGTVFHRSQEGGASFNDANDPSKGVRAGDGWQLQQPVRVELFGKKIPSGAVLTFVKSIAIEGDATAPADGEDVSY